MKTLPVILIIAVPVLITSLLIIVSSNRKLRDDNYFLKNQNSHTKEYKRRCTEVEKELEATKIRLKHAEIGVTYYLDLWTECKHDLNEQ